MITSVVTLGVSGRRIGAAVLVSLPILGLGLFAIVPRRPGATLYAALVGLSSALGRWLLGPGYFAFLRAI